MKDIGKRMKANYEDRARYYLIRRMPVIIRVDGKAFHSYTRGMEPFDGTFMSAMLEAAIFTAEQMQGFKLAYIQSDEASFLLTDYDKLTTEAWFDYNKSKMESIAASAMTMGLLQNMFDYPRIGLFDARAFNVPREEIANYFLWRMKDWERNSLHMYCDKFFSHKELHNKSSADRHEMLHTIGKNWATDLNNQEKNGTLITPDYKKGVAAANTTYLYINKVISQSLQDIEE